MEFLDSSLVTSVHIKEHTRRDPTLSKVMRFVKWGGPLVCLMLVLFLMFGGGKSCLCRMVVFCGVEG